MEDFSDELKFKVGQRVQVFLEEIPPSHINCDTGIITKINTRYAKSPDMRRHEYHVVFDKPFIVKDKVLIRQIHELTVPDNLLRLIK